MRGPLAKRCDVPPRPIGRECAPRPSRVPITKRESGHREGAPSVTALYRVGAAGNRAGQAGDRTQITYREPPLLAAGYSPLPGNRRGRLERVPAEFRCAASSCPAKWQAFATRSAGLGSMPANGCSDPGEVDDVLLEVRDHLLGESTPGLGDAAQDIRRGSQLLLVLEQNSTVH
jgi:hypothetical protein